MNLIKCGWLEFVPGKIVEDGKEDFIFIFSKKRNKRILKRDRDLVGFIFKHPKTKKYAFMTEAGHCMSAESMSIVNTFMEYLDRKMIKFNPEKGELSGSKNFRIPKEYENDK